MILFQTGTKRDGTGQNETSGDETKRNEKGIERKREGDEEKKRKGEEKRINRWIDRESRIHRQSFRSRYPRG